MLPEKELRHATPEELKKAWDEAEEYRKRWRKMMGLNESDPWRL